MSSDAKKALLSVENRSNPAALAPHRIRSLLAALGLSAALSPTLACHAETKEGAEDAKADEEGPQEGEDAVEGEVSAEGGESPEPDLPQSDLPQEDESDEGSETGMGSETGETETGDGDGDGDGEGDSSSGDGDGESTEESGEMAPEPIEITNLAIDCSGGPWPGVCAAGGLVYPVSFQVSGSVLPEGCSAQAMKLSGSGSAGSCSEMAPLQLDQNTQEWAGSFSYTTGSTGGNWIRITVECQGQEGVEAKQSHIDFNIE